MASSQGTNPEKPRKTAGNGAGRGSAQESGGRVFQNSPTGSAQDIHRTPPQSVEAEQGVLGADVDRPTRGDPRVSRKSKRNTFTSRHTRRCSRFWSNSATTVRPSTHHLYSNITTRTCSRRSAAHHLSPACYLRPNGGESDYYLEIAGTNMFCADYHHLH